MRRAVAIVTLGTLLAGCSATSPDDDKPEKVDYRVTLEATLLGAGGAFYGMNVDWGYLDGKKEKEDLSLPAWKKEFTLTWPDERSTYVVAQAKPASYTPEAVANLPQARCRISINGKLVRTVTSMIPQCTWDMSESTPPEPAASAG